MKRTLRTLLLTAFLAGAAVTSKAQLFLGVGAYGHQYKDLGFFPGVQARLGVEANEGFYTAEVGFNYSPTQISRPVSVVYTSGTNSQQVTQQQSVSIYGLTFHGAINLGNDEQDFRVGFLAGFSAYEAAIKYEKGAVPAGYKYSKEDDLENASPAFWNADVGIKANYRLGNGAIYAEALTGIPLVELSSQLKLAGISSHYGLQVGYKFNLNNTRYAYRNRF